MMDPIYISNERQDQTEEDYKIKGYDHTAIPQEATRVFNVAKTWENDWKNYGQEMLINGIEESFSKKGIISTDEEVRNLLTMSNRVKDLNKMPPTVLQDDTTIDKEFQFLDKVHGVQTQLNNIKIEKYNELYPEIVEDERKEVLREWFNPDSDRRDGELYWGRFTIQSSQELIDLRSPSEVTVNKITAEIQRLFPNGVNVRICIKEPTYETNTIGKSWNSYSNNERTFPVFISYSVG